MARKSRKAPIADEAPVLEAAQFRVGIYTRLSNEATASRESDSLIHQRELCMEYLKDKPDMAVVETYTDNGFTGTNFYRDDFQRMVDDIHSGKINCVVVKDLSRFGRNYLEVDQYLNVKFPEWKVRFIAVLDHFDTAVPDKDGQLIIPFRNILNDYYSRDFSKKIRSAIRAKMKSGTFVGTPLNVPYGYLRDGENHTYQINPETAPVLRRIFQMRLNGNGYKAIAVALNDDGLPSPFRYLHLKGYSNSERFKNSIWISSTVRQILGNPAYLGIRIHHKSESGLRGANRHFVSRDQQIWIEHAHEPLVSQETFDKVQIMNRKVSEKYKNLNKSTPECDFRPSLNGRIFCGDCGSRIIFLPREYTNNRTVLLSRGSRHVNYPKACSLHSIPMPGLIDVITHALNKQVELASAAEQAMGRLNHSKGNRTAQLNRQRKSLDVRKKNLNEKKSQLLKDYMDQLLNRQEYFFIKEQYESQSEMLAEELVSVQQQLAELSARSESAKKWAAALDRYSKSGAITNEIIQELVERIDLYQQGKQVEVKLTFGFRNIFEAITKKMESND